MKIKKTPVFKYGPESKPYRTIVDYILIYLNEKPTDPDGKKQDIDLPAISKKENIPYNAVLNIFSHCIKNIKKEQNGKYYLKK